MTLPNGYLLVKAGFRGSTLSQKQRLQGVIGPTGLPAILTPQGSCEHYRELNCALPPGSTLFKDSKDVLLRQPSYLLGNKNTQIVSPGDGVQWNSHPYSRGHPNMVLLGRSAGPVPAGPVPEHPQLCKAPLCVRQVEPLAAGKTRPLSREVNGTIRTDPDVHELHSALYPSGPERGGTLWRFTPGKEEKNKIIKMSLKLGAEMRHLGT